MLARVLLIIANDGLRGRLRELANGPDSIVSELAAATDWLGRIGRHDCDLVVADRAALPEPASAAVEAVRQLPGQPELLVVSAGEDATERAGLLAAGCMAVVSGKLPDSAFGEALSTLIAKRREASQLHREAEVAAGERFSLGNFVSHSPSMRKFINVARRLSESDSTVLILGETGVGKERLARAIHTESHRATGPLIVLNCGAVPESLLESELFGHEKGAFTGAIRAHRGHFELAHRGTIFLDEIGEMPMHLQVKLLRVLQEKSIQRIGGEEPLQIDVRVMAATNRDLLAEMQEKRFRPDLYYRLSVVPLEVPPLRERKEDIPALVESYFQQFRTQMPTSAKRVSPEVMPALIDYEWPGNIRELMNVVERAVLLCDGDEITAEDFPDSIVVAAAPESSLAPTSLVSHPLSELDGTWVRHSLAESRRAWTTAFECSYLKAILHETRGRIGEAATRAGIDPRSLYAKMKQHGLRKEDYR